MVVRELFLQTSYSLIRQGLGVVFQFIPMVDGYFMQRIGSFGRVIFNNDLLLWILRLRIWSQNGEGVRMQIFYERLVDHCQHFATHPPELRIPYYPDRCAKLGVSFTFTKDPLIWFFCFPHKTQTRVKISFKIVSSLLPLPPKIYAILMSLTTKAYRISCIEQRRESHSQSPAVFW